MTKVFSFESVTDKTGEKLLFQLNQKFLILKEYRRLRYITLDKFSISHRRMDGGRVLLGNGIELCSTSISTSCYRRFFFSSK